METTTNSAPAGMSRAKFEIFVMNGEVVFLEAGKMQPFSQIPVETLNELRDELEADPKAMLGLEILGIVDPVEQLKQYAFCCYGAFDKVADVAGGVSVSEYWECGRRPCVSDGLLCKTPPVPHGKLTTHDAQIMRLVSKDLPNKIIADILGTSVHTVNRQVQKIAKKIGCFTKTGIATFANRNNIF